MKPIKLLHCIQSVSWGGLELYTTELILKLAEAGVEQTVLCSAHSRVAEELKKSNIPVITFPEQKISKLKEALLIRKAFKEHGFTHLHSHTRLDMWACALALCGYSQPKHFYNLYMNALPKKDFVHRWLFSKVDALCSSSEFVLSEARKNFPIAPEKLHLIRYGRKTAAYQPHPQQRENIRNQWECTSQQLAFGTLCRIDPGKGVREMVEALEFLSDEEIQKIHMVIVGEPTIQGRGPQGEVIYEEASVKLAEWIDEQSQSPRLKGHLHRVPFQKEYIPMIDALDVFVLASHNETYSLSVLDAMLMQKPVIGTNAGGTTEQIGQGNLRGHLVTPKSAASLAEALKFYIQNTPAISAQGAAARDWVLTQHNWDDTLKVTLDLYHQNS